MAIVWNVQKLIPDRYSLTADRFQAYGPLLAAGNPKWHLDQYANYDTYSHINIWTYYWERHAIVGVNAGTDTISIFGDWTSKLGAGVQCVVTDSTGNNGIYTVSSAAYDSTNTNVVMNEDVPDGTVDGYLMFDAEQQIAMVYRSTDSYSVSAANSYSGGAVGYRYVCFAYNDGDSGTLWATVDGTTNPYDTATFCSDADSYLFAATGCGSQYFYDCTAIQYILVDEDNPNVIFLSVDSDYTSTSTERYVQMFLWNAFQSMDDASDAQKSLFLTVRIDADELGWGDLDTSNTYYGSRISFRDSAANIFQDGRIEVNDTDLLWSYEEDGDPMQVERATLFRAVGGGWTQGRKGILDERFFSTVRRAMRNVGLLRTLSGPEYEYYIAWGYKFIFPWDQSRGLMI